MEEIKNGNKRKIRDSKNERKEEEGDRKREKLDEIIVTSR